MNIYSCSPWTKPIFSFPSELKVLDSINIHYQCKMPIPSFISTLFRRRLENERVVFVETTDPNTEAIVESIVLEYARDTGAVYIDDLEEGKAAVGNSVRYPCKEYVVLVRRWQIHGSRKILVSFQDVLQDTSISRLLTNLKVVFYGSNEPMEDYRLKQKLLKYRMQL